MDSPPKKRRFWQLQLSTVVLAVIATAGLIEANMRSYEAPFFEAGGPHGSTLGQGWPFNFKQLEFDVDNRIIGLHAIPLFADVVIGLILIVIALIVLGWLIRHLTLARFLGTSLASFFTTILISYIAMTVWMFTAPDGVSQEYSYQWVLEVLSIVPSGILGSFLSSMTPWSLAGRWACFVAHLYIWGAFLYGLLYLSIFKMGMSQPLFFLLPIDLFLTFIFGSLGDTCRKGFWSTCRKRIPFIHKHLPEFDEVPFSHVQTMRDALFAMRKRNFWPHWLRTALLGMILSGSLVWAAVSYLDIPSMPQEWSFIQVGASREAVHRRLPDLVDHREFYGFDVSKRWFGHSYWQLQITYDSNDRVETATASFTDFNFSFRNLESFSLPNKKQ